MSSHKIFGVPAWCVFWVLFLVLVIPSGVFIYTSFGKLDEILQSVSTRPASETDRLLKMPPSDDGAFEKRAIVALERDVMVFRQHRAAAALATRTWMRFMSLIFGAILVVIGSAFILGKISTVDPSSGAVGFGDVKGSFATSSPGIALVFIGGLLIGVPHFSGQQITIDDTSSFIGKSFGVGTVISGGLPSDPSATAGAQATLEEIRKKYNLLEEKGLEK